MASELDALGAELMEREPWEPVDECLLRWISLPTWKRWLWWAVSA